MKFPNLGWLKVFFLSFFAFITIFPKPTLALGQASIYIGPPSGTFTVGNTFTVSVYLNTGGQFVNAIEANLSFPPDKLQVVSPTAGKSIIQLWVDQPTYSNLEGTIKFQGAIPTPGINTQAGVISTVTFRVRSTGTATIKVLDTSRVLLNDGKGTDILGQTSHGVYALILPPPAGPTISSPTHPDQEKWYAVKNAVFRWEVAPDAQGSSYVLNDFPVDDPDDISEGSRGTARYENLSDGIHYFHIKSLRAGVWGGVTHYGVKVDATPPAAFNIEISPRDYTSNRRPIIAFETTDTVSSIDHYELKLIPIDGREFQPNTNLNKADAATPFFIEAVSPYSREFSIGRYDVIVRAFDEAGNFYQASHKLTIANPIFEVVRGRGLRLGGAFTIPWIYVWVILAILLALLGYLGRSAWTLHRHIEKRLAAGSSRHPTIIERLKKLREKQKEYGSGGGPKNLIILALVLITSFGILFSHAQAQNGGSLKNLPIEPPVVTLFPKSISNDEIFYIGGRAQAPESKVIIYLQEVQNGSTLSHEAATDKTGAWFYSLPQFLNAGKYLVWTQLKVGEEASPPSSRLEIEVAPTAIQVGQNRISFQNLYLTLLVIFVIAFLGLLVFTFYHSYHSWRKREKLIKELKEAEESIRRGFLILRRDIQAELALVRKAKLRKEILAEEKLREEKLLKDLEFVNNYISKEIWDVEKEL
ncbi:MAG: hypothetical protein HYT13_02830 [Candidatus Liptonbacteria bacterium]|nr:hypothetical protein [Candidatus Liptonbacteria bacterium]